MEKNNRQKNKRNRKRHAELERIALYAVGVILLGLVIGLAVKNYRLKSKLDNHNEKDSVATGTSADSDNRKGCGTQGSGNCGMYGHSGSGD